MFDNGQFPEARPEQRTGTAPTSAQRTLQAGAVYFTLVFGAGFVLGLIRVLWLVPRIGERAAEIAEQPVMLVVILFAARGTIARLLPEGSVAQCVACGLAALALLLTCEVAVVLALRDLTLPQYLAQRDPVAGGIYLIMLALFAAMPALLRIRAR
ncbi:MAG: hypothetical protein AB7Q97_10635 [Gammaproteobacteria bacterium]